MIYFNSNIWSPQIQFFILQNKIKWFPDDLWISSHAFSLMQIRKSSKIQKTCMGCFIGPSKYSYTFSSLNQIPLPTQYKTGACICENKVLVLSEVGSSQRHPPTADYHLDLQQMLQIHFSLSGSPGDFWESPEVRLNQSLSSSVKILLAY